MERERIDSPTLVLPADATEDLIRVQKCKLLALAGPLQGHEITVEKDFFTIGSDPHNDLCLDDTAISRRHCEIRTTPEGYSIQDLDSTNGTYVQGVRIEKAYLDQGTEFQLGHSRLVFCPLQETTDYLLSPNTAFGRLLGTSASMRHVFHLAETYAPTDATVMIQGETGTGKEVLAEEIHRHSHRQDRPFMVIDCAALARELIESELFGHTRGAFTGAASERIGAFEHADGGTVFLDEIGELSPDLQPKLLRVLEKKEIRRLGSNEVRRIDVRIICATNRTLENEINNGGFREDLYYRLSVVRMELPPLRHRPEDLPVLTKTFLREFCGEDALAHVTDLDAILLAFKSHQWPGNVRELRNLIEMAAYNPKRPVDLAAFLSLGRLKTAPDRHARKVEVDVNRPFKNAKNELVADFEKQYVKAILKKFDGNISMAAREAGIERAYLQRLVRKHGLK